MIRNIIFDFGNVLFDLDLAAFEREMKNLWGENFAVAKEKLLRERVFELYETGGPVSYTHLDVYKRQDKIRVSSVSSVFHKPISACSHISPNPHFLSPFRPVLDSNCLWLDRPLRRWYPAQSPVKSRQ